MPGSKWTAEDDEALRAAAHGTYQHGLKSYGHHGRGSQYANRMRDVARRLGRSYEATLKRAQRIGACSYRKYED